MHPFTSFMVYYWLMLAYNFNYSIRASWPKNLPWKFQKDVDKFLKGLTKIPGTLSLGNNNYIKKINYYHKKKKESMCSLQIF